MTTTAASEATPSHTSCVFHRPVRPGCSAVADAIAVMPTAASASAAAIVGRSSLSSSRRFSTASLGVGLETRLQRGRHGLPLLVARALLGEPVLEEQLEHLAGNGGGRRSPVAAVLDHDRERDLRLLGGCKADEPGMIALVLRLFVGVHTHRLLEHLCGPGLPRD